MSTALFFALAYLITWVPLIPPSLAALGALDGSPDDYMAGAPLAIFGPAIAAVIASRREGGWARARELLGGLGAWRVAPWWYLVALGLPALVFVAGRAVYGLVPGNEGGPWFWPPATPEAVIGAILVPVGEEIGWRGYALPRLMARHGPVLATLILGSLWAGWHLPMLVAAGTTPTELAIFVPFFVAGAFLFTWVYQRTGGSLLLAVLLHVGTHLCNPTQAAAGEHTALTIAMLSYVGLAVLLVAADRRRFARHGFSHGE